LQIKRRKKLFGGAEKYRKCAKATVESDTKSKSVRSNNWSFKENGV
jgi:hypothetical protein